MRRSLFDIPKMDCPSEERVIRLALGELGGIVVLSFDIPARQLTVHHECDEHTILRVLEPLGFGASLRSSVPLETGDEKSVDTREILDSNVKDEAVILKRLLGINAVMFLIEIAVGVIASSTGLIADSLDMFADASVYGISLYAVGRGVIVERRAASLSGWFQIFLALTAFIDVIRRAVLGSEPVAPLMIGMALFALFANATCLAMLFKHRHGGVHMKASWIFSANDVIANSFVILAGIVVTWVNHPWPDLVIGSIIALVVLRGGVRILRLTRGSPFVPKDNIERNNG
jgi:Co/Zn/Cd efflux system component